MTLRRLSELNKGEHGVIQKFERRSGQPASAIVSRMMEMGILEGAHVEVVEESPFGRDPFAVRVRGGLVALRREEARQVHVEVADGS